MDKKSKKGFYELNYQIALYVEDRDLKQKSVIGVVMNLDDEPLSETEKGRMQELRIIVKKKVHIFNKPNDAVKDADVIFSDKVISLNDKVNVKQKLSHFKSFRITPNLIKKANKDC